MQPFFSIIIATYNSEKTLEYTLRSIQEQTIDQYQVEVIVVDGGSEDTTLKIAKKYGARVLDNPKRLPEYAKAIGAGNANGRYIIRMDSDEEFTYPEQLQDKMDFLMAHPEIKMLLPNRYETGRKELCGISAEYINILGDPFSYFIYQTKYDKYETYRKNIIFEEGKCAVMRFTKNDIYPLADSTAAVLSLEYMKEKYPDTYDSIEFICSAYDRIIDDTGICGCIKGDNIRHNCSSTFRTYLSKLRFRVINNLFNKEESGFSAQEHICKKKRKRKILFCLYALILPIPILDSVRLSVQYRNITYMLHFVYLYYVCIQLLILGGVKIMGWKRYKNYTYGDH